MAAALLRGLARGGARCVASGGRPSLWGAELPSSASSTASCARAPWELFVQGHTRTFASSSADATPKHFLVPMPLLSPLMTNGKVMKWNAKVGEPVSEYDLLFEVETNTLTEREDCAFILDVETMEDGYLAKVFVQEGEEVPVYAPLCVVCDNKEDVEYFKDFKLPSQAEADKAYTERTFLWQAYIKGEKGLDM